VTSFAPSILTTLRVPLDVAATMRAIGEGKGRQALYRERAPDALENLRQVAIIESTESSNRLEGVTVPHAALVRLVRENADPAAGDRPEGEIAGYRNVLNLIHERHAHMQPSPNLLLQLHRDLFRFAGGSGGQWKNVDNSITERRPDGSVFVRFQPTLAWRTPEAINLLHGAFAEAEAQGVADPLILIGLYILDFLCIHPFADGNGRMARLLTVLLLYCYDYEVGRYVSLERLIEETKDRYYDTLYRSSQGWHESVHDPMPWVAYFLGVVKAAYDEFARGVGDISGGRGAKTRLVRQAIDRMIGDFSVSELHQRCPSAGLDMVRHVLRAERDAGRLEVSGYGRGARWRRPPVAAPGNRQRTG
jgi:Fic family protein